MGDHIRWRGTTWGSERIVCVCVCVCVRLCLRDFVIFVLGLCRFYELLNHEMQKVNRHFSLQLRSIVDPRVVGAGGSEIAA